MSTGGIDEKYLDGLKSGELLLKLTWDEWLTVNAPFENVDFSVEDVTVRYHRNGYDWDMHGSLYSPVREVDPRRGFMFPRRSRQRKDHGPHAGRQTRFGPGSSFPRLQSSSSHLSGPLSSWRRLATAHSGAHAGLSLGPRTPYRRDQRSKFEVYVQHHSPGGRTIDGSTSQRPGDPGIRSFHWRAHGSASDALFEKDKSHRTGWIRQRRS
jgi:hypothetical protein